MKFAKVLAILACDLIVVGGAYIAGHSAAMHQHAGIEECDKLLRDENSRIDNKKYIIEAFKDFKRMLDDPLGHNRLVK